MQHMRQLKSLSVFAAGLACGLLVHWMPESSVNAFNAPGSRAVAGEQQDAGRRAAGGGIASGRGSGCAADIAPLPGGDGVVDINDLLAVINSWGSCPVDNSDADQDGWTVEDGDCDDTNPDVHPGAIEICNGIDDDCDGEIDEDAVDCTIWYLDMDGDGFGDCSEYICACQPISLYSAISCGDCDDTNPNVHPGAIEICNGIDDDCDGEIDEGC